MIQSFFSKKINFFQEFQTIIKTFLSTLIYYIFFEYKLSFIKYIAALVVFNRPKNLFGCCFHNYIFDI